MIVLITIYVIIIGYALFISWLSYGVKKAPLFEASDTDVKQGFTIIIPFRDELNNLPRLLESIEHLDYSESLYEILLVNDSSEDASVAYIETHIKKHQNKNIQVLDSIRISGSPKKDAIQTAINLAKYSWIVTTDADCVVPPLWLNTLASFIEENDPKLIAGPVTLPAKSSSFLHIFEQMDTLSLAGATIGGFGIKHPFLCNGAHLAYEKRAFIAVNGFQGNNHIASGDDHFILEKFSAVYPDQVHYLKSQQAIIITNFQEHWTSFIRQRKRWAAKSTGYTSLFTKSVGFLILLSNISFVIGVVFILANLPSRKIETYTALFPFLYYLGILFIKVATDLLLIYQANSFFKKPRLFRWYVICALFYPFISTYIALSSLTGNFTWKGRYFKR